MAVTTIVEEQLMVIEPPDISHLVTEDDTPVDNTFSEKQMRLLTHALYASWPGPGEGRPYVAMANVGLYFALHAPPLVPDVLLSLDVRFRSDPHRKENRCYFVWEYGKPPDVVVEIVSNRVGGELADKLLDYARLGISYYVVYDPDQSISDRPLHIFGRLPAGYAEMRESWLSAVGLGLMLWNGEFEGMTGTWLRWCDQAGVVVPTGEERAENAEERAKEALRRTDEERQRADEERQRADEEHRRAEALAAKLRALGIDPDA